MKFYFRTFLFKSFIRNFYFYVTFCTQSMRTKPVNSYVSPRKGGCLEYKSQKKKNGKEEWEVGMERRGRERGRRRRRMKRAIKRTECWSGVRTRYVPIAVPIVGWYTNSATAAQPIPGVLVVLVTTRVIAVGVIHVFRRRRRLCNW